MSEFKVEKDVPVPTARWRNSKYPWADMKVNDSFFVKDGRVGNLLTSAKHWAKREGNGAKFMTRSIDGGVRVWRKS